MKNIYILFFFLIASSVFSQMNPQSKKITAKFFPENETILKTTPALQKKRGYTDYKELLAFLNNLVVKHPEKIKLSFIGESQKGRKIPMVRLTNPTKKEKIKVWMQGGLHGNEFASTEGMLYLLDRLLNDAAYATVLDEVDLALVPMANIDGYLKGDRYSANGLDLNRDQTKLMAPESSVLKQAFTNFNPEVGVDFHEYTPYRRDYAKFGDFGVTALYDAMFLYTGNLNVPENLRHITDTVFVENARKVLDENNLRHHTYVSTKKISGEVHFNHGSISARSSATNYALTNTISTLIEVRGVGLGKTSFKRRIHVTFSIAISYLKTASKNREFILSEIKKASQQKNDVVVTSDRSVYPSKIEVIDLDANKIIELDVTLRDALKSKPRTIRKRPSAYLIDADQKELIVKLKILGAEVEELLEDTEINVESFLVKEYHRNKKKYEKMNQQIVSTELIEEKKIFKKGTFKISMNQRRSNIIVELLEPEASNSFVSFGVLETRKGAVLPIYRILN
jgi:hypothetical protein